MIIPLFKRKQYSARKLQNTNYYSIIYLLIIIFSFSNSSIAISDDDADSIISSMENLVRSNTNISTIRLEIIRPGDNREIRIKNWDDRVASKSFIQILDPRRDANTIFLKVDGNLWMYIPRLEREIKIPPAMMLGSWMGTDFTNDDLVNESSAINDYENTILSKDNFSDEVQLFTIESIPHPDSPVVWGKIISIIRSDGIAISQKFYDEDDILIRTMLFDSIADRGGRNVPTRITIQPELEQGFKTIMIIEDMVFNEPISGDIFTRANLIRRR